MTDGINLTGFNELQAAGTNNLDLNPTGQAPDSAFPAQDVSAQGNSGLNQEGSSASLPLSGPDYSDTMMGN
jgi:hypothetical protein